MTNPRLILSLWGISLLMLGFGYALVPIYNVLCKNLGINGKTSEEAYTSTATAIDTARLVTVQFLSTTNAALPWDFYPQTKQLKVHPGEMHRVHYHAKNRSDHTMCVQAIPSVTPGLAARYLKKTECFCFTQQTLASHQTMDMPLVLHIDPDLPKDITTVTLSYTLFDVTGYRLKANPNAGRINAS